MTHHVARIPVSATSAIARYDARVYAVVSPRPELAGEIEALRIDLQVSDSMPPLTLPSAVSLFRAERGDFAAVGGETVTAHVEALVTRFATLPPTASVLLPLDVIPDEPNSDYLNEMLIRFDVRPSWFQHEHFFVDLPVTDGAGS